MAINFDDPAELGQELIEYCKKFFVPTEHIFEILYDQKVVPMIRGKGMEFNAEHVLRKVLPGRAWIVSKLNLAAQQGSPDEDLTITNRRSGITITVESKAAVRESFATGTTRTKIREPHFKVKCHRSRSNIKKVGRGNDRYKPEDFDIVITNTLNSIYLGNTIGEDFEFPTDNRISCLYEFYQVSNNLDLEIAAYNDWRFAVSRDIAVGGLIPRTPYVRLRNDPKWKSIDLLEDFLLQIIQERR